MADILEIILTMVLTLVALLGGGYLVLAVLGWGLRIKSGSREQEGLTRLWASSQTDKPKPESQKEQNG
jgi:O-antigen ligase